MRTTIVLFIGTLAAIVTTYHCRAQDVSLGKIVIDEFKNGGTTFKLDHSEDVKSLSMLVKRPASVNIIGVEALPDSLRRLVGSVCTKALFVDVISCPPGTFAQILPYIGSDPSIKHLVFHDTAATVDLENLEKLKRLDDLIVLYATAPIDLALLTKNTFLRSVLFWNVELQAQEWRTYTVNTKMDILCWDIDIPINSLDSLRSATGIAIRRVVTKMDYYTGDSYLSGSAYTTNLPKNIGKGVKYIVDDLDIECASGHVPFDSAGNTSCEEFMRRRMDKNHMMSIVIAGDKVVFDNEFIVWGYLAKRLIHKYYDD
ncbi:MAG TPA: hypothetical protein PLW14_13440 [Chlorobiota bacterium]|nr:hypothetical protein [Chlorobiota bacterium]